MKNWPSSSSSKRSISPSAVFAPLAKTLKTTPTEDTQSDSKETPQTTRKHNLAQAANSTIGDATAQPVKLHKKLAAASKVDDDNDPPFVREQDYNAIRKFFKKNDDPVCTQVLLGTKGMGKTRVARKYENIKHFYDYCITANADTEDSIRLTWRAYLQNTLECKDIPFAPELLAKRVIKIITGVKYNKLIYKRILLVFHDAKNYEVVKPYIEALLKLGDVHFHVLITSSFPENWKKVQEEKKWELHFLEDLPPDSSSRLMMQITTTRIEPARDLVERLPKNIRGNAYALRQAGRYVARLNEYNRGSAGSSKYYLRRSARQSFAKRYADYERRFNDQLNRASPLNPLIFSSLCNLEAVTPQENKFLQRLACFSDDCVVPIKALNAYAQKVQVNIEETLKNVVQNGAGELIQEKFFKLATPFREAIILLSNSSPDRKECFRDALNILTEDVFFDRSMIRHCEHIIRHVEDSKELEELKNETAFHFIKGNLAFILLDFNASITHYNDVINLNLTFDNSSIKRKSCIRRFNAVAHTGVPEEIITAAEALLNLINGLTLEKAQELKKELNQYRLEVYAGLVRAYRQQGRFDNAGKKLEEAKRFISTDINPDAYFTACLETEEGALAFFLGRAEMAWKLFSDARSSLVKQTYSGLEAELVYTLNYLLLSAVALNKLNESDEIYEELNGMISFLEKSSQQNREENFLNIPKADMDLSYSRVYCCRFAYDKASELATTAFKIYKSLGAKHYKRIQSCILSFFYQELNQLQEDLQGTESEGKITEFIGTLKDEFEILHVAYRLTNEKEIGEQLDQILKLSSYVEQINKLLELTNKVYQQLVGDRHPNKQFINLLSLRFEILFNVIEKRSPAIPRKFALFTQICQRIGSLESNKYGHSQELTQLYRDQENLRKSCQGFFKEREDTKPNPVTPRTAGSNESPLLRELRETEEKIRTLQLSDAPDMEELNKLYTELDRQREIIIRTSQQEPASSHSHKNRSGAFYL